MEKSTKCNWYTCEPMQGTDKHFSVRSASGNKPIHLLFNQPHCPAVIYVASPSLFWLLPLTAFHFRFFAGHGISWSLPSSGKACVPVPCTYTSTIYNWSASDRDQQTGTQSLKIAARVQGATVGSHATWYIDSQMHRRFRYRIAAAKWRSITCNLNDF
jgi:hypothetical protein